MKRAAELSMFAGRPGMLWITQTGLGSTNGG